MLYARIFSYNSSLVFSSTHTIIPTPPTVSAACSYSSDRRRSQEAMPPPSTPPPANALHPQAQAARATATWSLPGTLPVC